jgi:hypothetical protein
MRKSLLCLGFALMAMAAATTAAAGELSVKISNGRATIIAKDVPVRQILAEWAKVGETKVVNGEKIPGGPVTIELVDVPEKEALDVLLRTAAGYIAAPRPANLTGASQFDRVIVLAVSRPRPRAAWLRRRSATIARSCRCHLSRHRTTTMASLAIRGRCHRP